jgi:hypothetical protein
MEACGCLRRHATTFARCERPGVLALHIAHQRRTETRSTGAATVSSDARHINDWKSYTKPLLVCVFNIALTSQVVVPVLQGKYVGGPMPPLLLWQTCLWVTIQSCYFSHQRGAVDSLRKRLALCLIMLALLPANARPTRSLKVKAMARKGERVRRRLRDKAESQRPPAPVFFKACPTIKLTPQLDAPAQETGAGAHEDQAHAGTHLGHGGPHGSSHHVDGCPEDPAQALPARSPRQPHGQMQTAPAASRGELEPLTPSPFDKGGTPDLGSDMRSQLMWLNFGEAPDTQQGGESMALPASRGPAEEGNGGADPCNTRHGR